MRASLLPAPPVPRERISPRPGGGSRKLSLKSPGELQGKGLLLFCISSFLWATLFLLQVLRGQEADDTLIDGLVPADQEPALAAPGNCAALQSVRCLLAALN